MVGHKTGLNKFKRTECSLTTMGLNKSMTQGDLGYSQIYVKIEQDTHK